MTDSFGYSREGERRRVILGISMGLLGVQNIIYAGLGILIWARMGLRRSFIKIISEKLVYIRKQPKTSSVY
jgi:hypothetical protein